MPYTCIHTFTTITRSIRSIQTTPTMLIIWYASLSLFFGRPSRFASFSVSNGTVILNYRSSPVFFTPNSITLISAPRLPGITFFLFGSWNSFFFFILHTFRIHFIYKRIFSLYIFLLFCVAYKFALIFLLITQTTTTKIKIIHNQSRT